MSTAAAPTPAPAPQPLPPLAALVAAGPGYFLMQPPRDEFKPVDLEPVRALFPLIRAALFLFGIGFVILFVWLAFGKRIGVEYIPELGALLLAGVGSLASALWL